MSPPSQSLRPLGSSGPCVHPLCLGGNVFGWTADRATSFTILDRYVAAGGNFLDTADQYSEWVDGNAGGESETIIGQWLARRRRRDDVVIATKVGYGHRALRAGLRRETILRACDASLLRLGVDEIDVYYLHRDDPETQPEETAAAVAELLAAGKIRSAAASNYSAARLEELLAAAAGNGFGLVALQPRLNLIDRAFATGPLRGVCEAHGLGVTAYAALASGFLSGKYAKRDPGASAQRDFLVAEYQASERASPVLAATAAVAARHGATRSQVALAWVMCQPTITAAIASARTTAQLEELLGAVALRLDEEDLERLDRAGRAPTDPDRQGPDGPRRSGSPCR